MGRRNDIDWEPIERDYILNQLSVRALAKKYGVQASAIIRHCDAAGLARDHTEELRIRTRAALLGKATPESNGNATNPPEKATPQSRKADIDAAVETNRSVLFEHRGFFGQARGGLKRTLARIEMLETALTNMPEPATQNGRSQEMALLGKLLTLYQGAVATMAKIVPLERQALNIDDGPETPGGAVTKVEWTIVDPPTRSA